MKILEEFYYGNITPHERDVGKGCELAKAMALSVRNEDALLQTLTDQQKETFEKYLAVHAEMDDIYERDVFIRGFAFGLRFMAEAYQATSAEEIFEYSIRHPSPKI